MVTKDEIKGSTAYKEICRKCKVERDCVPRWIKTFFKERKLEICYECTVCGSGNIRTQKYDK